MIRDFSKEELAPAGNDTELTLGAGAFLGIGCALLVLCAICFGLGYVVGHRSSPDQSATAGLPAADTKAAVTGSGTKPGAGSAAQAPVQPQTQAVTDAQSDGTGITTAPATGGAVQGNAPDGQVRPALATQTQPGRSQVQGWMVQIAAVSHQEDAQVLVDALRKHGYEATARRDLGDNLIHVQAGPFVNRNDANAIRQKLLSDGYNAIVQ